jgi:hypothetical protein
MNLENEFDELARRKLEERSIPFQESDWLQAQALLARQKRKSVRIWPWMLGLLLVGSSTAWWLIGQEDEASAPLATTQAPAVTSHTTTGPITSEEQPSTQDAEAQIGPAATNNAPPTTGAMVIEPNTAAQQRATGTSTTSASQLAGSAYTAQANATEPSTNVQQNTLPSNTTSPATAPQGQRGTPATPAAAPAQPTHTTGTSGDAQPSPAQAPAQLPLAGSFDAPQHHAAQDASAPPTTSNHTSEQLVSIGAGAKSDVTVPNNANTPTTDTQLGSTNVTSAATTAQQPSQLIAPDSVAVKATPADSTAAPQDSLPSASAAPVPLQGPTVRSPWEVSALVGLRQTNATYRSEHIAADDLRITGQRAPFFGAELMHTGRNLSYGAGIGYGSWSEQVDVAALDRTRTTIRPYWMLVPVDTTLLIITDTLFQGTDSMSFTGISQPSTVNVIRPTADTTSVTERLREARTVTVRSSYVEVAPLIDLHVTQARWTLGVRGGPTVGLLSGRRGELPSPGDDGGAPFREVAFREVMLGYQARAYVRYRWNAGWSIGLEPMIGGTLLDTFNEAGAERRVTGYGVLMSLTYRLP